MVHERRGSPAGVPLRPSRVTLEVMPGPSEKSFPELLSAARAGSNEALGALMESMRPHLRAFLRQNVGGSMKRHLSTSDLEQDVLLGAQDMVTRLPADAQASDLQALVLRHAHWAIGKASRKSGRIVGESALPENRADPAASVPSTGQVTAAEELERFQELLSDLPDDLADVIRLRGQDLTFQRIGEELDIGEDAARKRFLRGARILRGRIRP